MQAGMMPGLRAGAWAMALAVLATSSANCWAQAQAGTKKADKGQHILKLVEEGKIAVDTKAANAYRMKLTVHNRTEEKLIVNVPPGLVVDSFANSPMMQATNQPFAQVQPLAVLESRSIPVAAGATETVLFNTCCMKFGVPEPNASSVMFLKSVEEYSRNPLLRAAVKIVGQGKLTVNAAQATMWRITNNLDWRIIGRQKTPTGGQMTQRDLTLAEALLANTKKTLSAKKDEPGTTGVVTTDPPKDEDKVFYTVTFNPDPRGTNLGGHLVRNLALNYGKVTGHKVEVDHANYMPEPVDPKLNMVHWNVLVRAPNNIKGRYVMTLLGSVWDPKAKAWQHGKLKEYNFTPPRKVGGGKELIDWFAGSLGRTLTSRMVEFAWTPRAAKKKITITNRLPFTLKAIKLVDERRGDEVTLDITDTEFKPGEETVIELSEEQLKVIGKSRRMMAVAFERKAEKEVASTVKPVR